MTGTRLRHIVVLAVAFALASVGTAVGEQQRSCVNDQQWKNLVKRIDTRSGSFQASLERALDRSQIIDGREKNEIIQSVKDFRQSADRLRDRANDRQSDTLDVEDVLRRGAGIDRFMQRYQLSSQAERDWLSLRGDLDGLARGCNVAWNLDNPRYTSAGTKAGRYHRLTGTYQLEVNQGDDPRQAAERASRAAPSGQRQRTYQDLLARLEAPELIAFERNGNAVTMASTRGQRVSFEADGRDRSERWSNDRNMNTRATFEGERLVVTTTGSRGSDFTATFDPMEDGRRLQMTRTIDDEGLREPVTVRSYYRRTSDQARWEFDTATERAPYATRSTRSDLVVPDGIRLVAMLDDTLSTRNAREGDVFTMTTRSPSEYEGAVIEGVVSTVTESERLTGRAGIALNLRSIRLRDGRSYRFDGIIDAIRTPDGETVRVDREGTIDSRDSQTQKAVERGAIGAAVGALIGAVAGGGKGAAIGAVIGAGGGAGTVLIGGRDQLDLERGTEVTISSGDPRNRQTLPSVQR